MADARANADGGSGGTRPGAHAYQAAAAASGIEIHAVAVVTDRQAQAAGDFPEFDIDASGFGVAGDVSQRLLGDAEELGLDDRLQAGR